MTCKAKTYGAEGSHPPEVISQDSEHRFVTDAQIEQWTNGTAGQGQYMAMMFRRSATVPDTPEGGSFSFPIPNGGQWTNTILPGIDPVFISTRFFTSDGKAPQQAVWSPPVLFVKHGSIGPTGPKGDQGTPGIQGPPGNDGINGADGVNGNEGVSIVWLGEADSHPLEVENGNSYRNTVTGKSYIYWDGAWYQMTVDGQNGSSIVWKGDLAVPPENPEINWVYRDTDNHQVYIFDGLAWELMIQDGIDGTNGLSVFITYHDADPQGIPPTPPTNVEGTNNGWHTDATADVGWMSQKVDDGTGIGWGLAIPIRGSNGASGPRGSNTFTIDENDAGSYYITPAVAESWAGTLTNENAQAVAKDIIGVPSGNGFSPDGYIRPNDKITVSDHTNQIAGTRIYLGISTDDPTTILASHFSGLITEVIDGNLLINGTVSVDALGADVVSAGKIKSNLLLVTNAEISGQIKSDAVGSTNLPMWEINKDGALILRAADGTVILQSGGTLDKNFIDGLGDLASVNKITPANISTYMDSAAIGSAYIADAAVGTLKIQENAVMVPVGAYTANNIELGTDWVTIQQATINALGQPVSIDYASAYYILWSPSTGTVTGELYCRLVYSTGTEIIPEYMVESQVGYPAATLRGTVSFSSMIFPAGSVTVYLQLRLNTTSGLTQYKNAFCRYLGLIGMKR